MTDQTALQNVQDIWPLSPTQEGMLYEILRDPAALGRYDSILEVRLSGVQDPGAFASIFEQVALAPDISRACFLAEGAGAPVQIIRSEARLPIVHHDWRDVADLETEVQHLQDEMLSQPLPLTQAPLMSAVLLRLPEARHILLWRVHHLISDGWSAHVVLEDVMARACGAQAHPPGPSFRTHLARRKQRDRAADTAFFKAHFAGFHGACCLARPAQSASGRTRRRMHAVRAETTAALRDLARGAEVSFASLLSFGWALTLRRLTGRNDVVMGRVVAGRDLSMPGIDRAIGPYLNVVPTRFQIDPAAPVRRALRTAEEMLGTLRPFETTALTDSLAGLDSTQSARLPFDTLVSVQGFSVGPASGKTRITGVTTRDSSGFPLALLLEPGDETTITAVFDDSRIDACTAEDVLALFAQILSGMAAAPDAPVSTLSGLPLPPVTPHANAAFVHDQIMSRAAAHPAAPAVDDGQVRLSYGALHRAAAQLAVDLGKAGLGRGDMVPVVTSRTAETAAAMLGVLYAGAAYVPIDPDYPAERNRMVLETLNARLIVGNAGLSGWQGDTLSVRLPRVAEPAPDDFAPVKVQGSDPAYVLFTSGSTGAPKGVVISHDNLAWSNGARAAVYGDGPAAFLLLSSFAFDSSVVGLYWTLTSGGTLHIAPTRAEQDPRALMRRIARDGITHLLCLPHLWAALLDAGKAPQSLDTAIVAGEAVPETLTDLHRARAASVRLFNEYGPTEACVWCAAAQIADARGPVPIGHAPPGAALDVVDLDNGRMPQGLSGALLIRGAGVAGGYLGHPPATGGFVDVDGPAFRTGDVGAARADGAIVWQGRSDSQIKIRGHRVELSEIEAAARAAGAADAAAALDAGQIILAVVDPPGDLQGTLARTLPAAARPGVIHTVRNLPRLPNGKTDRRALAALAPEPEHAALQRSAGFYEGLLSEIWSEMLGRTAGPETEFFDAGGDSLMTIDLRAKAERRGLVLRPGDLFDYPVLGDLAAVLRARLSAPLTSEAALRISVANPHGTLAPVLMIHGSPTFNTALANALGPDRPFLFNWSHHLAGRASLRDRIETLADEAMAALDRLRPEGPCAVGGFSLGAIVALEVAQRLRAQGRVVTLLALVDPSYEIAPPPGQREPADIFARRSARAALAALRALTADLRGADAVRHAQAVYQAILWRYRPVPYDGPSLVLLNALAERDTAALAALTPGARRVALPYAHMELLHNTDAIADVAAQLVAALQRLEQES